MNNFSPHAQQVLALARKEADRFCHNFVGTEHVLLGIVALGQSVAVTALQNLGMTLEAIRARVEEEVSKGDGGVSPGPIPFTPRVKKSLAYAVKEAADLKHALISPEHLLLGIVIEGEGLGARILHTLGTNTENLRAEILKVRDQQAGAGAAALSATPGTQPQPAKASCTVNLHPEILEAARKLGMILDEYIEHLHKLHYSKGDTSA